MDLELRGQQKLMKQLGFDPGPTDGLPGPKTEAAYEALRAALGLVPAVKPVLPTAAAQLVAEQPEASRPIFGIVIHCTATPEGRPVSVETISKWHVVDNGWSDIGYHYVVGLDGTVYAGRTEAKVGAHVKEANTGTLGVVYVGGTDAAGKPKDTRTPAQKQALTDIVTALCRKYSTIKWVKGHNDFTNAKACPSFKVGDDPLRLIPEEVGNV